jgi:hypothetical protein
MMVCGAGYPCKEEGDGTFMLTFADPCKAMEWALTMQLALMHVSWSRELLERFKDVAGEVWDDDNQLVCIAQMISMLKH